MTSYRVYLTTSASLSVRVDIDDEGIDEEEARERAIAAAYEENGQYVCAKCSGWRQRWSFQIGEWEIEDDSPATAVERLDES